MSTIVSHLALDQMRDDFRVRFSDEPVALALELLLQIQVVLDDPVVHHDELSRAVAVGMGVLLGRTSVRGPARVADAVVAADRIEADHLLEVRELARPAPQADHGVLHDCDARRIVAAVLQLAQPVDEHGDYVLRSDVSNDPAHVQPSHARCPPPRAMADIRRSSVGGDSGSDSSANDGGKTEERGADD
jgi:hypothetical protein